MTFAKVRLEKLVRSTWLPLSLLSLLSLCVLVAVTLVFWRVESTSSDLVERSECAVDLAHVGPDAQTLPTPCLHLSASERELARREARCLSLRQRASAAGQNPKEACLNDEVKRDVDE